jgi:EAL domain-containing protein (putative c-di-GMP-specific phosphodiesterase class I)
MYVAKHEETGYAVYDPGADSHSPDRLQLVHELRRAIEQDELVLHYQPKVTVATGHVEGVEALVRWDHPRRGLIPPDQFIPLAERTGLILPLTWWVLDHALQQCRQWQDEGLHLGVAVNLSARNLLDRDLSDSIAASLQRWDVEPDCLEVELTESTVMADPFRAISMLTRLHETGVRLAIDDFGTGYSSLGYLKRLPVDEIKIDRSFVLDMAANESDYQIVRATISLSHDLGLHTVAEGVEDDESWERLATLGCDLAQGYYLTRPLPAGACADWLRAWQMRVAS